MVKIQISSDKKMGKVKTMVLPAKRNSDKTTTKKSNKFTDVLEYIVPACNNCFSFSTDIGCFVATPSLM